MTPVDLLCAREWIYEYICTCALFLWMLCVSEKMRVVRMCAWAMKVFISHSQFLKAKPKRKREEEQADDSTSIQSPSDDTQS